MTHSAEIRGGTGGEEKSGNTCQDALVVGGLSDLRLQRRRCAPRLIAASLCNLLLQLGACDLSPAERREDIFTGSLVFSVPEE